MSEHITHSTERFQVRPATRTDSSSAYYVCLKTGDFGDDGEAFYSEDPDALGRIFVGPYLEYEPSHSLVVEDEHGVCGYALGALDSRSFYDRYEREWRPMLCAEFPDPSGPPENWTRTQQVYHSYHHPDYFVPEPYEDYPSHLHIDLLPRAQGCGVGRKLLTRLMDSLAREGSRGVHLGMSVFNKRAFGFYQRLGFAELTRAGKGSDACIYMGQRFASHVH